MAVRTRTPNAGTSLRPARLYGMKHSHPVLASRMALERTAIPFEPHDVLPGRSGRDVLPPVPAVLPPEWLPQNPTSQEAA